MDKTTPAPWTPPNLDLDQIMQYFATDEKAREYLEAVRWPNGPRCPHCGNADTERIYAIAPNPGKKIRPGLRDCAECHAQFTVTVGTIFEGFPRAAPQVARGVVPALLLQEGLQRNVPWISAATGRRGL